MAGFAVLNRKESSGLLIELPDWVSEPARPEITIRKGRKGHKERRSSGFTPDRTSPAACSAAV